MSMQIDDDTLNSFRVMENIMSMHADGKDKNILFDKLLAHLLEVTGSNAGIVAELVEKDGRHFHEFVSFKLPNNEISQGMKDHVNMMGGYYISGMKKSSLLSQVYRNDEFIIKNKNQMQIDYSSLPIDHFKMENFIGVPINNNNIAYGCICLANKSNNQCPSDYTIETYKKIEPFKKICGLLFHCFNMISRESIYEQIIDNISIPIVVYKGSCRYDKNRNIEDIVRDYRCVMVNKAFCQRSCPIECDPLTQVKNHTLFESFPKFKKTFIVLKNIKKMFDEKQTQIIECVEYEDYLFSKSQYQFKFYFVDDMTFILSFDDISDKIKAKQTAEDTAKSKEEFIANISHEMRTPLNGIMGYTALIMDTPLNEYQKDCFTTIRECSMNLLFRVNDLLDLSKLTAGKMELLEEDFSLPDCIHTSYNVNSLDAKNKKLDVAYFIEPDVPNIIKGDCHKLQQILVNLLSNAMKFTDNGKINTHIKLINDSTTNAKLDVRNRYTIEFTVSDTGIGITEKDLKKLFTPFNQLHPNDRINNGTGLGLVITKKLSKLMGGDITAESVHGKGSKFIFYIKVQGNDVNPKSSEQERQIMENKRVMVVDDNEMNRIMICSFLVEWGMTPISCSSAKEALFYVERNFMKFDLILVDIRMPCKDGNQLADEIYKINPTIPLIALSSVLLRTNQISPEFKYYLTKPIKRQKLKQICIDTFTDLSDSKSNLQSDSSEDDILDDLNIETNSRFIKDQSNIENTIATIATSFKQIF